MRSLKYSGSQLSSPDQQIDILEGKSNQSSNPAFDTKLQSCELFPLSPVSIDTLQVNVGKVCNQTCKHCHVDAAPDRSESMSLEIFEKCLEVVKKHKIPTVDITGGAPEINPNFRWFVHELHRVGVHVISRCNLTIINANKSYADLPEFYAAHKVEVISSLPYFTAGRTDSQRGNGVFESSISALKQLNEVGYGMENSELTLNLVYNPSGAFLPGNQATLEKQFKKELHERYGIYFDELFCITNLPISRFLDYLLNSGNYDSYMEKLINTFNPAAARNVMCRNLISVGWDGLLYDCDFNQMLELGVQKTASKHINDFDVDDLLHRKIVTGQHCFGCTSGAGSSCGGEVIAK